MATNPFNIIAQNEMTDAFAAQSNHSPYTQPLIYPNPNPMNMNINPPPPPPPPAYQRGDPTY